MARSWRHYAVAAAMVPSDLATSIAVRCSRVDLGMVVGKIRVRQGKAVGLYLAGLERIAADPRHPGHERAAAVLSQHKIDAAVASVR